MALATAIDDNVEIIIMVRWHAQGRLERLQCITVYEEGPFSVLFPTQ